MKIINTLLLLFVIQSISYSQYDPKALEILEAMSKKYKALTSFQAILNSKLINETEGIEEEFNGKITVKGEKFHLDIGEQQIINNGHTVWTYLPSAKEVNIDNVDKSSDELNPTHFYTMYKKGFKYLFLGELTENGVVCEEIDLVPEKRNAQFFKIKLLIAKKDKSIIHWTMFDRSGNKFKYSISNFVSNSKVSDAFFTFDVTKHPGVEVIDLR